MAQGKMLVCFHLFPLAEICVNNSLMYCFNLHTWSYKHCVYIKKTIYVVFSNKLSKMSKFQILIINIM